MTTVLSEIKCKRCQNMLIRNRQRLGLSRQVNKIRREGTWYEKGSDA
jgi:hypothetical protein